MRTRKRPRVRTENEMGPERNEKLHVTTIGIGVGIVNVVMKPEIRTP